ncbi:MAG: CRISPR-associated protein Csx16 [Amphritea sp.]
MTKTWFISRHPGAMEWLEQKGIAVDCHVAHLDTACIAPGDKVIGSLPVNLASKVCQQGAEYWHLSLELAPELRGKELSPEQMEYCGACLELFHIELT